MLKRESQIQNDLINSYYSCVLFKKYYQYNFWFGNFNEYNNIKYCKSYIQKYIYCWINFFLLQRFSLSFVIFLYKSPYFTKFVESGFLKYLDYHFLLSFYSNCFFFDLKSKQVLKSFVKFYFQIFLKKHLEKDLLILLIVVINEIFLNIFLKPIEIYVNRNYLNDKKSFKLLFIKKNYYYLLKSINFKDNNTLKSAKVSKLIIEKSFIVFLRNFLYIFNTDVQYLIESVDSLVRFNSEKNIGIYRNSNILCEVSLVQRSLLSRKIFKNFFKSFNISFVNYKYKRKFL